MTSSLIRDLMLSGMLFVGAAGLYAFCYALGRMLRRPAWVRLSFVFAALEVLGALGMIVPDYLAPLWKYLIAFATGAYLVIPPAMWWVVVTFHTHLESGGRLGEPV